MVDSLRSEVGNVATEEERLEPVHRHQHAAQKVRLLVGDVDVCVVRCACFACVVLVCCVCVLTLGVVRHAACVLCMCARTHRFDHDTRVVR